MPLLWLVLVAAGMLTWNTPVQPRATIAGTKSHVPWFFSPDGRWLLAGSHGKDSLLELATGRREMLDLQTVTIWPEARPCGFSNDCRFFVGRKNGEVCLWDLDEPAQERKLGRTTSGMEPSLGFSLDSRKVAIVQSHRPLEICDVSPTVAPVTISMDALFGRPKASWIVYWAWGGGQTFLAEEYQGNRVSCWDVDKWRIRFQIENLAESYGVTRPTWRVSPDGSRCVAIVTDGPVPAREAAKKLLVQAWDIPAGKLLWERLFPPKHGMFDLSFLPDSKRVAICSRDYGHGHPVVVHMWDVEDGTSRKLAQTDGQEAFVATAGGRFLFHSLGWWEFDKDQARPVFTFHDNGYWHDRQGNKHTPYTENEQSAMPPRGWMGARRAYMYRVGSRDTVAVRGIMAGMSPDDRWLASRLTFDYQPGKWVDWVPKAFDLPQEMTRTGRDYELQLFDVDSGSAAVLHDAEHWLFSPDGKFLVTGGAGDLRVWPLPLTAPVWQRWLVGFLVVTLLGVHWRNWRRAATKPTPESPPRSPSPP